LAAAKNNRKFARHLEVDPCLGLDKTVLVFDWVDEFDELVGGIAVSLALGAKMARDASAMCAAKLSRPCSSRTSSRLMHPRELDAETTGKQFVE
jgi:hypothetical protein